MPVQGVLVATFQTHDGFVERRFVRTKDHHAVDADFRAALLQVPAQKATERFAVERHFRPARIEDDGLPRPRRPPIAKLRPREHLFEVRAADLLDPAKHQNIYINDASILPGNTGESPQASIMAFAKFIAKNLN